MVIFLPELAEEDLTAQLDRASGYITSVGGTIKEVLTDSPWGRRRLAYPIRFNSQDYRDGFYAVYHFDLVPTAVADVERELKLDTRVMRYLVVHDDPKAGEKNTGGPEAATGADADSDAVAPTEAVGATTPEAPTGPAQPAPVPEAGETNSDVAAMSAPVEAPASAAPVSEAGPAADDAVTEPAPAGEPVPVATPDNAPADSEQED